MKINFNQLKPNFAGIFRQDRLFPDWQSSRKSDLSTLQYTATMQKLNDKSLKI